MDMSNLFSQLRKSIALAKKNIRVYYNKGPVIIFGLLVPLLLYFAFTMNRTVELLYVVSGLLGMILIFTASSIGPAVFPWETMAKTLERLVTTPITLTTLLFGDIWASLLFGMMISVVPIIIGLVGGLTIIAPVVLVGALILGCFAFACFGIVLSSPPTEMPSTIMIISFLVKFPLLFISPIFIPVSVSPWTVVSPLTPFIDMVNYSFSGVSYFGTWGVLIDVGLMLLWTLFFLSIGLLLHKKTLYKRFKG